ncbi:hypothetical protein Q8F57_009875 [Paraburkholderia terrae]|uniref:hypothetical protein n=1 Tax=Paraburkholderia terrae TaxID=311230 RepID=UPI00296B0640|nr:hypothetical protein [Paraburkholderia terrae]MDW3660431.1 hypothetical protein [Paraburkholderia terrae]
MTTTFYDMDAGILASDSRWSAVLCERVVFLDDTGFDKIEIAKGHAFLFAGDAKRIQEWKSWMHLADVASQPEPEKSGIALLVVECATGVVKFAFGYQSEVERTLYAGSGGLYASRCWIGNKCAQKAVRTASSFDLLSGGDGKFLELATQKHNLMNTTSVDELHKNFIEKGTVMYAHTDLMVSVKAAAANDPIVQTLVDKIASGQLSVSAPCAAMHQEWTDADKSRLSDALDDIFARR